MLAYYPLILPQFSLDKVLTCWKELASLIYLPWALAPSVDTEGVTLTLLVN